MSIFYDPAGCNDGPAIVRELEGGDTHPVAVPINDCTTVELRVMAAAPEMLAALEAVVSWAQTYGLDVMPYRTGCATTQPAIARARAAIAAARGEASP